MESHDHRLPAETTADELRDLVQELNEDEQVDGILVQLPLPTQLDGTAATRLVSPAKDVDGFHPVSAGQLYLGHPTFVPATPAGIMELLDEHEVELEGRRAVVGRSQIVGKPMAHLLLARNATVTICHSRTMDLAEHTRAADVLVAGVGHPHLITVDMVKEGAAVVDVGITRQPEGLAGDVHPAVEGVAGHMTPARRVGPMTIAILLRTRFWQLATGAKSLRFRSGVG